MKRCKVCDDFPVPLGADSIARINGPRLRATLDDLREFLCFECQRWAARIAKVIA